jgi:ribonuclease HII
VIIILICGIDEAGRGPILGPLVMCGILVKEEDLNELVKLRVKDSKLLTKLKREGLFDKIKDVSYKSEIISVDPKEVDDAVNNKDGLNLNKLEAKKTAEIINLLKPDKAIVDAPSNNIKSYRQYLFKFIKNKNVDLILEHKADLNYPIVSGASILAKVTRDAAIEKIKSKIKIDFGSGYMSDSKTAAFLEKYYEKHSELFRKSWAPYKNRVNEKFQSSLEDFSQFVEKAENKNKNLLEKLKKLEDLGYKFIETSTEHEHVRMKGLCTITLYKSGKLLVQGKDKDKKDVDKLIS